jgi:hypothetical protein
MTHGSSDWNAASPRSDGRVLFDGRGPVRLLLSKSNDLREMGCVRGVAPLGSERTARRSGWQKAEA